MIRVLIAEDIDSIRAALAETIDGSGDMRVVGRASTGAGVAKLARETDFDVALMDIEMESAFAGIRATEDILADKPDARVIFLTIHETDQIVLSAMGSGACDYVVKGCPDEELLRHIRAVRDGHPMMQERIHAIVMQEYSRLRKSEQSLLFFITNIARLTGAERELVKYLLQGFSVAQIAKCRCVEIVTVKTQIKGVLRKFGCGRTKEIVQMIRQMNLTHLFLN